MEEQIAATQLAVPEDESVALLRRLNLTAGQITALRNQGFVACECRDRRSGLFKLRFRVDGKQIVRSLGTSTAEATRVAVAVQTLQRPQQVRRELRKLEKESRTCLKSAKQFLSPALEAEGYQFHGLSVRRSRG